MEQYTLGRYKINMKTDLDNLRRVRRVNWISAVLFLRRCFTYPTHLALNLMIIFKINMFGYGEMVIHVLMNDDNFNIFLSAKGSRSPQIYETYLMSKELIVLCQNSKFVAAIYLD